MRGIYRKKKDLKLCVEIYNWQKYKSIFKSFDDEKYYILLS
jgi:hypothetical protein